MSPLDFGEMGTANVCRDAILLVAFNRPETFTRVIDAIRLVKPARVYVAFDGPRPHVRGEAELVQRSYHCLDQIDWECTVEQLRSDRNLGCGRAVSGALEWFFDKEQRGIVLEDDIVPSTDFFRFCSELLDRYEDDLRVFSVSGCNFLPSDQVPRTGSYRFSGFTHVWGWATWRRSWESYRFSLANWREDASYMSAIAESHMTPEDAAFWAACFDSVEAGAVDTWDYQLVFAQLRSGGLCATSNFNLADNVGFGTGATHTHKAPSYLRSVSPPKWPLSHPDVALDERADRWTYNHILNPKRSLVRRTFRRVRRLILPSQ